MPTPKEIEIKLDLPPANLQRLKKIPLLHRQKRPVKSATEVSVYFDTDKHKLRRKGIMLRVRRSGDRYVQTIKSAGNSGPFARDEWEVKSRKERLTYIWRKALRLNRCLTASFVGSSDLFSRRGFGGRPIRLATEKVTIAATTTTRWTDE